MNKRIKFIEKMLGLVKNYNLINYNSTIPKTPKEDYILKVYMLFHIVDESISNLNFFETYLSLNPIPNHFTENNISEKDYYKFHFENFYTRCTSIIDFNMHLINTTLQIGLPKNKCGYHSLKENLNIKETRLSTKMINFYNDFQEHIKKRNEIIHHGFFDSELLDGITAYSSIPNLPEELFDKEHEIYSNIEKTKNIKIAVEELKTIIKRIEFHFGEILEELIQIIEQQISFFEIKEIKTK